MYRTSFIAQNIFGYKYNTPGMTPYEYLHRKHTTYHLFDEDLKQESTIN